MGIFDFIKGLFKRLIMRIIKRKQTSQDVALTEEQKAKFNSKQQKVIVAGLKMGLDIKRIAKQKYSAEQMALLMYGLTMGLDISTFESYTMPPLEMEYHLYMEAVDKYLGKNYLKTLLCNGENSVADEYIQKKIRKDLTSTLEVAFEMAPTLLIDDESTVDIQENMIIDIEEESIIEIKEKEIVESQEDILFNTLKEMCDVRGINKETLSKTTIAEMTYEYEKLEVEYAQILDKRCVGLKNIQEYSLEPHLITILRGRSLEERVYPIKLFSHGKLLNEFYQVNSGSHIYLYREKFITIKIR